MSSAINNRDYTSYHLPRGYFKRRKPPDDYYSNNDDDDGGSGNETCQASIHNKNRYRIRSRFSNKGHVNNGFLLLCTLLTLILTIMINDGVACDDRLKRDIEENALFTTPTPPTLPNDGICKSVDARFELDKIHALTGCRVVEGSVTILLMDELDAKDVANISFPDLVEITGYLMMYRIGGFTSLNQLFPNLAVIRGKDLFKDYALIIYEMLHLMEVGLKNLLEVERGNVRIEKNEQMCFTHTIQWPKIITKYGDPYLEKNKLPSHCPNCPVKCPKSPDGSTGYCWNLDYCQRLCVNCAHSCSPNGTCCDKDCIGGCENGHPNRCTACKKFAMGKYPDIKCVDQCPEGTYAYLERRCLLKDECYELNTSNPTDSSVSSPEHPFIPFEGKCIRECPPRYTKSGTGKEMTCNLCNKTCLKRCVVKTIVDSIETAQALKGCSIIDGPLEIQIRGTTKNPESGKNLVKELEASLSDIVEINDYLKIARSHPILSMSFLKNLRKINGNRLEGGRNALVVWENHNLQELWDETQTIEILNGKLFFHFNPKLCFYKIEQLANKSVSANSNLSTIIENYDTAKISNGDKTPCNVTPLNVTVENIFPQAALLSWDPLKLDDERSLLNYVVFYIAAPYANVTLWDGRDACGNDGWSVEDVNDFSHSEKISQPLTKLEPYTQYAYYVKAYTLATEKTGAQSEISYFTTKPDIPDLVKKFKATPLGPDRIEVTWETLKKVNGRLKNYVLRAKAVDQNENLRLQRDYCKEPLDKSVNPQTPQKETTKDTPKLPAAIAPDGTCDCKACSLKCDKQATQNVEDRQSANDFEDQIQDFVYVHTQNGGHDIPKLQQSIIMSNRPKRQVINEFPDNVSDSTPPHINPETLRNTSDFFDDEIKPERTSYEIRGLKHYTTYSISIRACREKEIDEIEPTIACGHEVNHYAATFREPSFDDIPKFDAERITNGSNSEIRVTWDPPKDPNGLLLTYTIRYNRVDIDHTGPQKRCVSYNKNSSSNQFILRLLSPGNYSIDMMATSLAGDGNYTKAKYVVIKEQGTVDMLYIVFGLLGVFIICFLLLVYLFKRMYLTSISSMKIIATVNPDYAGVTYRQDEWEIPRDKIIQLQELGCGSFGMVYEGIIKDFKMTGEEVRCAIKTVNESATDKERISFLNEASVMKQFDTHHVVHLLGVVSQGQPIFVIMELMANGDLKGYLRSHRPEYDNGTDPPPQPPTLRRILQMAIEIADGMAYLAAKKFVHRDLAARNCMVAEDLTVKIGDFGMTRDIYETDYYRKGTKGLLPVRWMAPESLKDGVFTSSSDVFSYGVVVWEMATLASQPYQGLSNDQVLRYVIEGGVMERPENCPDKLYELMRRCWQHRPSGRPSFMEIITMLLDDVSTNFQNVSFFHSPVGQDIWHQLTQGELAVLVTDDVTTPLRQDEEDTSSIDGNHFLMEDVNSNHHRLDDL